MTSLANRLLTLPAMPKLERVRDFMTAPPSGDYFSQKSAEGWRLVAVEWERGASLPKPPVEDVPFGLRVASDCKRLEEDPDELQVLILMMETIVQDGPLSAGRRVINDRGYRTRDGEKWTPQSAVLSAAPPDRSRPAAVYQRRVGGTPQTSVQRRLEVCWKRDRQLCPQRYAVDGTNRLDWDRAVCPLFQHAPGVILS